MEKISPQVVKPICSSCSSAQAEEIVHVSQEESSGVLQKRTAEGFTGVLRLSFKEAGKLNSTYCIMLTGEPVFYIKEVVAGSTSTFYIAGDRDFERKGAVEIFRVPVKKIEKAVKKLPEVEGTREDKKVSKDIQDLKGKLQQDAEKAADEAVKAMKPDIEKLKKEKLSPEECREVIGFIERELAGVFGDTRAKYLVKLRLTEMRFSEENASCEIVVNLVDYVRNFPLKNKVGKEEANRIAERMLQKLAETAKD